MLESCLLFGFATFIRFDTLVLIGMLLPMLWFFHHKQKVKFSKVFIQSTLLLVIPYLFYFIWVDVFIKYYMPITFNVANELNHNLADISIFFTRLHDMTTTMLFSNRALLQFGLMTYLFMAVILIDVIFFRKFNTDARIVLYAILVVYIGLPLLGYLIPWFDLDNTTKRGLYKILPLMVLYIANSASVNRLSIWLNEFENHPVAATKKPTDVKPQIITIDKKKK